ncbi:MAG: methyltransferase [Candidatus Cloacimonetes bacterium]|nr:methyltransferase [Candidatus Cloacimonadota bacterium]MCA9785022.1 methyltransferase [Candidatus Cloacimonadota bacterium]
MIVITRARDRDVCYAYDLFALKKAHPLIGFLEQECEEPFYYGTRVWNSGWLAIDHLEHHGLPAGSGVIDLGCGWGLLGIFCARRFGCRVLAVDTDPLVAPFLDLHARINEVSLSPRFVDMARLSDRDLRGRTLLAGADICFWPELVTPLFELIRRALDLGVPRILISDPGREPFETLAARCRKELGARILDHSLEKPKVTGRLLVIDR